MFNFKQESNKSGKNQSVQRYPKRQLKPGAILCIVLLALFSTFATAAELQPAERADLMTRLQVLIEKHPAIKTDFVEERMSHLLNKPLTTEGSLQFSVPNKFRREMKGNNPSTTVSNGKVLWIYYPKFQEAELYALGQHSMFDDTMQAMTAGVSLQHFDEFYHLNAYAEEGGYRLVLTPKRPNLKRLIKELTLWLDPTLTPVKGHLVMPKGDEVSTTYKNVVRGPIPDSTFDFTPPTDTHIAHPLGK